MLQYLSFGRAGDGTAERTYGAPYGLVSDELGLLHDQRLCGRLGKFSWHQHVTSEVSEFSLHLGMTRTSLVTMVRTLFTYLVFLMEILMRPFNFDR